MLPSVLISAVEMKGGARAGHGKWDVFFFIFFFFFLSDQRSENSLEPIQSTVVIYSGHILLRFIHFPSGPCFCPLAFSPPRTGLKTLKALF